MASTFKNAVAASIGTTPVVAYTVPASTVGTVIGLSLANRAALDCQVTVTLTKGGTVVNLIKSAPVPVGSALALMGGDQKLVMETGNLITITSTVATSIDVVVSVLEIS